MEKQRGFKSDGKLVDHTVGQFLRVKAEGLKDI